MERYLNIYFKHRRWLILLLRFIRNKPLVVYLASSSCNIPPGPISESCKKKVDFEVKAVLCVQQIWFILSHYLFLNLK